MAFNSWDKLAKAQRDYPKPKLAMPFVDKSLKKQPNNPYLLTWKADIGLQQYLVASESVLLLDIAHRQPILDIQLLSYMYKLSIEAIRRTVDDPRCVVGLGKHIATWTSAAKTMKHKSERIALWESLFFVAMQEDLWEDARIALVNYQKDAQIDKKQAHYCLILVTQLAGGQKYGGTDDQMARLQLNLAVGLVKQAYSAPPDDPIAMKSIRELRFMAEVFGRQLGRLGELQNLWKNPPKHLEALMNRHKHDLADLMATLLTRQKEWQLLEAHCLDTIDTTISELKHVSGPKSKFWEVCAGRWHLWGSLMRAVRTNRTELEAQQFAAKLEDRYFGEEFDATDRPLRLTYLKLRQLANRPTLDEIKYYLKCHSSKPTCFTDLREYVSLLGHDDLTNFSNYLFSQQECPSLSDEAALRDWRQTAINLAKFQYLLLVSFPPHPRIAAHEVLFRSFMRMHVVWPDDPDIGYLGIYVLLNMHHRFVCVDEGLSPLQTQLNSRILLQAAMFARHMVEKDKNKENRSFALFAARLHLNLGLGTIAFRLYRHAKCKEMLLDTLSPIILSRISQTHPFGMKGHGGFSADEELANVLGTIERMERKTDSYLLTDIPTFLWDQATDAMELKFTLNSSATKHLCGLERRRIARLKGESTESLLKLNIKNYMDLAHNVDFSIFPNFEALDKQGALERLIMPNTVPNHYWIPAIHFERERVIMMIHGETCEGQFDPVANTFNARKLPMFSANVSRVEGRTRPLWQRLGALACEVHCPGKYGIYEREMFVDVLNLLTRTRKGLQKLRMPISTTLKPEDEPTMFHENMLMTCYTYLEIIRAFHKLLEQFHAWVIPGKKTSQKHPLSKQKIVPENWYRDMVEETNVCYQTIHDVADSYITLLMKTGVATIKAQIRWGVTGECLKDVLLDDDVEYYAKEYVDSAVEAWSGVLKVKLK